MTAVTRGLSEHPLPNLVRVGSAGDPHVTPCPGRAAASRAATRSQHAASLNGAGGKKPGGAVSRDSLAILNCQRSLLAKVPDFPG